jgi:hypothetical protein
LALRSDPEDEMIKISVTQPSFPTDAAEQAALCLNEARIRHLSDGDRIFFLYSTQFERGCTSLQEAGFKISLHAG